MKRILPLVVALSALLAGLPATGALAASEPHWTGECLARGNLGGCPVAHCDDEDIDLGWGDGVPLTGRICRQLLGALDPSLSLRYGDLCLPTRTDDEVRLHVDANRSTNQRYGGGVPAQLDFYAAPPTITSLSRNKGPTGGGTVVTVVGTDFVEVTGVSFGGIPATTYTVHSDTQITATAPPHSAGGVWVQVATAAGMTGDTDADDYAYVAPPTVTGLSLDEGPTAGGTVITITGTDFVGVSGPVAVRFGGVNATKYTVDSATKITAVSPEHAAGGVRVLVTAVGGTSTDTSADNYTFVDTAPTYVSIRGSHRYHTAQLISQALFPGPLSPDSGVVVAPGETFQEALCGAPLAAAYGGPVLLTPKVGLENGTKAELQRLVPSHVFVIGLSTTVVNAVKAALPTAMVSSITGTNVYDMSRKVANELEKKVGDMTGATAIITIGTNFPDAIGVSPLACSRLWPVVLTDKADGSALHASAAGVLTDLGITRALKVGTYATLPADVTGLANLSGSDRYYTNSNVANWAKNNAGLAFAHTAFATGDKFPDALASGPYLSKNDGILLLSPLLGPLPATIGTVVVSNASSVQHVGFIACVEPVIGQVESLLGVLSAGASVSDVSCDCGSASGGTSVVITGTNFVGVTSVKFGLVDATSFDVKSPSEIVAVAPAGTGIVDITVTTADGTSSISPASRYSYVPDFPLTVHCLVINYDPYVPSHGNVRMHTLCPFWNDPHEVVNGYVDALHTASGGTVRYEIDEWRDIDGFFPFTDGHRYTADEYIAIYDEYVAANGGESWGYWGSPGWLYKDWGNPDYSAILAENHIIEAMNSGQFDEVLLAAPPMLGLYETRMVGPTAIWCNSPPLIDASAVRDFVIQSCGWGNGVPEALECFGHRAESILEYVFSSTPHMATGTNYWRAFIQYDLTSPGQAACGSFHFAPNSEADYDWGNTRYVQSTCDDWLNYPDLTGVTKTVNCGEWGDGDWLAHHMWWLGHFPKAKGCDADGMLLNWWGYVALWFTGG